MVCPIDASFHMEFPWDRGMKVYLNGPGHITKMAAMPIYDKTLKNLLLKNQKSFDLETSHAVSITDDSGLTMTYFAARSNLIIYTFEWGKLKIIIHWE